MVKLEFIDSPSQEHRVKIGDRDYICLFMYNLNADIWTIKVTPNGGGCPKIAGRPIYTGVDLFDGFDIGLGKLFCVVNSSVDQTQNWFDRMINGSGLMVFMSNSEYEELKSGNIKSEC